MLPRASLLIFYPTPFGVFPSPPLRSANTAERRFLVTFLKGAWFLLSGSLTGLSPYNSNEPALKEHDL